MQKLKAFIYKVYQKIGIKLKMILAFTVLSVVIVGVISLASWTFQKRNINNMIEKVANSSIKTLSQSLVEYISLGEPREYQLLIRRFAEDPIEGLSGVVMYDLADSKKTKEARSGSLDIYSIKNLKQKYFYSFYSLKKKGNAYFIPNQYIKEKKLFLQQSTPEKLIFTTPIIYKGQKKNKRFTRVLGAIQLIFDKEVLYRPIALSLKSTIQIGLYVLIAAMIGVLVFSLFLTRPVSYLQRGVEHVQGGDLNYRVFTKTRDELGFLSEQFNDMVLSLKEKLEIQKFVSGNTSEAIKRKIRDNRDFIPHKEELTFLFSDIRGFTSMSESMEPEDVIMLLNDYFERLSHIIMEQGGDIDKYVGDEIFAVFKGQDKEKKAVEASIAMQKAVEEINQDAFKRNPGSKQIAIGIGINTGTAVLGSMGSSIRMDYTAIGDAVNVGARLCSAAGKGEVVISETTFTPLNGEVKAQKVEQINVKGKTKALNVYKLLF